MLRRRRGAIRGALGMSHLPVGTRRFRFAVRRLDARMFCRGLAVLRRALASKSVHIALA